METNQDYLAHHGIKGQKWGVHSAKKETTISNTQNDSRGKKVTSVVSNRVGRSNARVSSKGKHNITKVSEKAPVELSPLDHVLLAQTDASVLMASKISSAVAFKENSTLDRGKKKMNAILSNKKTNRW